MKKVPIFIGLIIVLISLNFIIASGTNDTNFSVYNNTNTTQGITFNYPKEVSVGSEFNVNLGLNNFPRDNYDIKIEVMNNNSRIARIWNENYFQGTFYYINDAINTSEDNNGEFKLKITNCADKNTHIEVKIRDSKDKTYSYINYPINITGSCLTNPIENNLPIEDDTPEEDNPVEEEVIEENPEITLSIDYNENNIKNGNEFDITINAYDLEDKKYDIKVFIYDSDENKPITQTYSDKWITSSNYINNFFNGPGDVSKEIKLKIKDSYKNFSGEASIGVRIRESGSSSYIKEETDKINIIEKDNTIEDNTPSEENIEYDESTNNLIEEDIVSSEVNEKVIILGKSESIKSKKNTIYESKNEIIKRYLIYSFIITTIIFFITFIFLLIKTKKYHEQ